MRCCLLRVLRDVRIWELRLNMLNKNLKEFYTLNHIESISKSGNAENQMPNFFQ